MGWRRASRIRIQPIALGAGITVQGIRVRVMTAHGIVVPGDRLWGLGGSCSGTKSLGESKRRGAESWRKEFLRSVRLMRVP